MKNDSKKITQKPLENENISRKNSLSNADDSANSEKNEQKETQTIELDKQMEALRKELREMKEIEYKRLKKEFLSNKYGIKYNVSLEIVLSALFGFDFVKREISRFPKKNTRQRFEIDPNFFFKSRAKSTTTHT